MCTGAQVREPSWGQARGPPGGQSAAGKAEWAGRAWEGAAELGVWEDRLMEFWDAISVEVAQEKEVTLLLPRHVVGKRRKRNKWKAVSSAPLRPGET